MLWAGVTMILISYVFAIAFLHGCTRYLGLHGDAVDDYTRQSIELYWSSVSQSLASLYMASLGGVDWIVVAEPLLTVSNFWYCLFLIYIAIFYFVIVNILNSIFLEAVLAQADKDHQQIIENQMGKREDYIFSLRKLYQDMGGSLDGEITYSEFCENLYNPRMQAFASSLEIDISDARQLFLVLSDQHFRHPEIRTWRFGLAITIGKLSPENFV